MNASPDDTRMTCLKMAMEVARQTPGTDVVALAEQFMRFLAAETPSPRKVSKPVAAGRAKRFSGYHEIIEEVAAKHRLAIGDILGDSRVAEVCTARYEAVREVYRRHPMLSTPVLGEIFNRDHTTILYAPKKTEPSADELAALAPYNEPKPIRVGSVSIMPAAYTVASFCEAYGIRRNLAYDEMKAGRLLYRKAGRKTLIRRVDADAWLAQLSTRRTDAERELMNMNRPGPS